VSAGRRSISEENDHLEAVSVPARSPVRSEIRMPSGNRLTLVLSSLLFGAALAGRTGLAQESAPPLPPPRPDAAQAPAGREGGPGNAEAPLESLLPADPACLESLTRLGVRFEPRQSFAEGACRVHGPVLVSGLPDGVDVSPPALMTCPMAEGLARWILDTVLAAADRHFQTAPTKLVIGTSYECRNQRSGAKLSEHAFGNGVDVMGFAFHKRAPLSVGSHPEASAEAGFQSAVQKGACAAFTTVLGPGSDADHGDHLHLDLRGRRGDYRICQ
jgi:hypothetical protein